MTKYIVSGYIGFGNFGDEAIAQALTERLKKSGAEKITLISSDPQKTSKVLGVYSCSMLNFWGSLSKSDVLISGGGSLLQDVTSLRSLIYYLTVIYAALFFGKKVEIFAQGIGPINSGLGRILTKFALKRADKISIRDKRSQMLLDDWGIKSELVKDPILEMDFPQKNKKGIAGIQLRNCPALGEDFLNILAEEVIKTFRDKKIQIFSLQDSIDLEVCNKFARILEKKGRTENVEVLYGLSAGEVFEKISDLEYMVAMRFHACACAIKSGVRTIAINYDIKIESLAHEFEIPMIELSQKDISGAFSSL